MEKWSEVYTEKQLKLLQQLELQNLEVLSDVCQKLGIQFFLYGGSLIGAVRHKGFVPWDDDLDIAMMRNDYMRFIQEAPSILPEDYFLQTPYNDKKSPYIYTKLRLKGTRCIEYVHHKKKMEQGIYVDIYPIDNIPDDDEAFLKKYNQFQETVKLFGLRQSPYPSRQADSWKRRGRNVIKFVVCTLLKLIPHGCLVKKIDRIMTEYNDVGTKRQGNYSYPSPTNLFYGITPFEKGSFEGIEVNLPRSWDKHLSMRYGNYMKLPPEEKRIGHKPYVLDFGKFETETGSTKIKQN